VRKLDKLDADKLSCLFQHIYCELTNMYEVLLSDDSNVIADKYD
jgi:hypothetical protein